MTQGADHLLTGNKEGCVNNIDTNFRRFLIWCLDSKNGVKYQKTFQEQR